MKKIYYSWRDVERQTQEEFNSNFTFFDKSFLLDNSVQYMFRGIPLKVNNEN